jgi:hypothetical protein
MPNSNKIFFKEILEIFKSLSDEMCKTVESFYV